LHGLDGLRVPPPPGLGTAGPNDRATDAPVGGPEEIATRAAAAPPQCSPPGLRPWGACLSGTAPPAARVWHRSRVGCIIGSLLSPRPGPAAAPARSRPARPFSATPARASSSGPDKEGHRCGAERVRPFATLGGTGRSTRAERAGPSPAMTDPPSGAKLFVANLFEPPAVNLSPPRLALNRRPSPMVNPLARRAGFPPFWLALASRGCVFLPLRVLPPAGNEESEAVLPTVSLPLRRRGMAKTFFPG